MEHEQLTCALVATSDFNAAHFLEYREAGYFDAIVAVDAGLKHLEGVGCTPDYVLGDFDSLGYVPSGDNVEVHPAHKDASDLELTLEHVFERGCLRAVIYGALGGRLDHTIAALQMCARFAEAGMEVTLVGLESAVRILVAPAIFFLPLLDKGTVSVFAATDECTGVTERGLEYPLENARLTNRTTLGLSNELIGEPASISIANGTLYVFYPV